MREKCEMSSRLATISKWLAEPCLVVENVGGAKYCERHGCENCKYANKKKGFISSLIEGKEFCSEGCKGEFETNFNNKSEEEKKKIEAETAEINRKRVEKVHGEYFDLQKRFEDSYASFIEQVEGIDLSYWKGKFIRGQVEEEAFISKWHSIIEGCKLERTEKDQWKKIYQKKTNSREANLTLIIRGEQSFLLSLAKTKKIKHKKERNGKEEIIRELKQELNFFSPKVELKELPSVYHDYESLKYEELKIIKGSIIEEIRNKREEKKLSALLIEANACIDDELQEFIRKLEKFTWEHASKRKKNAYCSQKVQVDAAISSLWDRLDDLNEKISLISLQDDICRNFDVWIKEGEDLVLSDDSPFREFKEKVKNFKDKGQLLSFQNQAFQSIMEEFKNVVKKEIGNEKLGGESQIIDKSKNFAEVKLAREIVKLSVLNKENKEELGNTQEQFKKFKFIEGEVNNLKNLLGSNQEVNLNEVNALVEKVKEEIRNAKLDKSQRQEESETNSNSWLSSHWKEVGIIVFGFFLVATLVFVIIKKRKTFSSKN